MSKNRDEVKVMAASCVGPMKPDQQQQPQQPAAPRNKTRQNQVGDTCNQLSVLNLRFPDDFSEYVARAEGGGSTYGLLRRHAFAQTSLRHRRPTTAADDVGGGGGARPSTSRQRRSRSLVPPPRRRSGELNGDAAAFTNHKTLLQALCAQTQQQQQQQEQSQHTDTLQVNEAVAASRRVLADLCR